jgi:hypothetical protein
MFLFWDKVPVPADLKLMIFLPVLSAGITNVPHGDWNFFFFFPFQSGIRDELRALYLVGRCSTTWATNPTLFALVNFSNKAVKFCLGWTGHHCMYLYLPCSWDYNLATPCLALEKNFVVKYT